jgi:hypothetical protein
VVSTESAALAAHMAAVNIHSRQLTASVLLIQALGGDWSATTVADPAQAASDVNIQALRADPIHRPTEQAASSTARSIKSQPATLGEL